MNNAQLINQTSGDVEYHTPKFIIEPVRIVMGSIELDPASSVQANQIVKAKRIFTKEDDGLKQEWKCKTLFLNHPFGKSYKRCNINCDKEICKSRGCLTEDLPGNAAWINKLVTSWKNRDIEESAICITYACTSEKWFTPLMDYPQCSLIPRTNYYLPDGTKKKGVTKGSVITYFGFDIKLFREQFGPLGKIKI